MASVVENVQQEGNGLLVQVEAFLCGLSSIQYRPSPKDGWIIIIAPDYSWGNLQEKGLQEQGRLLQKCDHFFSILETLLSGQTASCCQEVAEAKSRFRELITQEQLCWGYKSIDDAVRAAKK
jgi:hypothetical protein